MFIAIASHPIQYQIPIWQELGRKLGDEFLVIFLCKQGVADGADPEFGREVFWDFDLLDGYRSEFVYHSENRVIGFWQNRLKSCWIFVKRLKQLKPNVVLIGGWNLLGYVQAAVLARVFCKAEIWLRCEANNFKQNGSWRSLARKSLVFGFLQICSKLFYIGTANKRFYESFRVSQSRLHFAGYGVDNQKFSAPIDNNINLKFRENFGLRSDSKVVLFCGKLIEKKRPMDLILALEKINFQVDGTPIQILFVGSGLLLDELKNKASGILAEFADKRWHPINFAGFLNQGEIINAYQASDLLVLPSDANETWGLVVNEALATGLPAAVSTSCGCAYDLVERYFPTMVFPEGDIDAICRTIEEGVFISRDQILRLDIVSNFSSKRTAEVLLNMYD